MMAQFYSDKEGYKESKEYLQRVGRYHDWLEAQEDIVVFANKVLSNIDRPINERSE